MTMIQTEEHNLPTLRFPEFSGEWKTDRLKNFNLAVIDGDRGTNYPQKKDFSSTGYCLFLNAKNVTKFGFSFEDTSFISQTKDAAMSKGKLNRGDILLTTRGSVGNIALFDETVVYENIRINSGMVILRPTEGADFSSFLFFLFNSPKVTTQIKRIAFGSAQPQLTVKEIKRFWLTKPDAPEQQKIASFLSSVDCKIAQLSKKKALLQRYKKGVMQKLFSQELRFKDTQGKDFPDWEEKRLGEVAETTTGSSNREDSTKVGEFAFFDRSTDQRASSRYLFDCEAIIVAGEGKDFPPKHFVGKFDLHQRAYATMNFGENIGKYLYYWIHFHRNFFLKYSVGSTMPSLRMASFSNFPVRVPAPKEQQKIADFLSSIDRKIDLVSTELDHAKTFKKGLLQQMFI